MGLIERLLFAIHVVADKAYDADYIINKIKQQRAILVIPPKRNRRDQRSYDAHIYKDRHLVACFFCKNQRVSSSCHALREAGNHLLGHGHHRLMPDMDAMI
jgi:transposase